MDPKQLTKSDLKLIRKVMEQYAEAQWKHMLTLPAGSSQRRTAGRKFNVAAQISRFKLIGY